MINIGRYKMLTILCVFYNIVNCKICDINGFSNGGIIIALWEDMIKIIKTNNNGENAIF